MNRLIVAFLATVTLAGAFLAPPALGEEYWIAWEGDTFPEEGEWSRFYGNWDGPWQGQAYRTLQDNMLTIDSLYDQGVFDFYWIERPGAIDPGPGEVFVMEWALRVEEVDPSHPTYPYDPSTSVFSNDSFGFNLEFSVDCIQSGFEHVVLPLDMTVMHEFRMVSPDMRTYDLYVDSVLFHSGEFIDIPSDSYVGWGDGVQGVASLHEWDYFRVGVIPEVEEIPSAHSGLGVVPDQAYLRPVRKGERR